MARIGVYDRYWPTGGGGEKFAAGIAAALADEYRVELLAHEPVDRDWLGERLALDLSAVEVRLVPEPAGAVSRASGDYDLFVKQGQEDGSPNCGAAEKKGTLSGTSESVSDDWSDDQGIGGEDDSVWLNIEVRHVSGNECNATWSLTVKGDP